MPWEQRELEVLRRDSVRHLSATKKLKDEKNLFTCDRCDLAGECEWVYHYDNINGHCLKKELFDE